MALTVKVISPGIGFFEIRRCFHVCNKVGVRLRGLMPFESSSLCRDGIVEFIGVWANPYPQPAPDLGLVRWSSAKGPFPQIKSLPAHIATPGKPAYQSTEQIPPAMPHGPVPVD